MHLRHVHTQNGRFRLFKFRAGCSSFRQGPEWTSLSPHQKFFHSAGYYLWWPLPVHVTRPSRWWVRAQQSYHINKVIISDQPRNGGVEVELGAPVALCVEFSSKYVTYGFVSRSCRSAIFLRLGVLFLYFQVVFILKILSGQSPFDYFFIFLNFFQTLALFLSCKDPSNKKLNWSGLRSSLRLLTVSTSLSWLHVHVVKICIPLSATHINKSDNAHFSKTNGYFG